MQPELTTQTELTDMGILPIQSWTYSFTRGIKTLQEVETVHGYSLSITLYFSPLRKELILLQNSLEDQRSPTPSVLHDQPTLVYYNYVVH